MKRFKQILPVSSKETLLFVLWTIGVGGCLAGMERYGLHWRGWLAYSLVLAVAYFSLRWLAAWFRLPSSIIRLMRAVFWGRLGLGVSLMMILPVWGYSDNSASLSGYLYQDAYSRDMHAWALAVSDQPLWTAFSSNASGDQYGGMLALSALTYRYLSSDLHRPFLILIGVALAGALSVAFFWKAIQAWAGNDEKSIIRETTAFIAAIVFAFYPEVCFLGSSHMREALVIFGVTLIFWGVVALIHKNPHGYVGLGLGALWLLVIQPPLAFVTVVLAFGIWLLEPGGRVDWKHGVGFAGLAILALAAMWVIWSNLPSLVHLSPIETFIQWLQLNFRFQSQLAESSSGMMQNLLRMMGTQWTLPVILGYGALQPVLPATLTDPAAWIWRIVNSLRAVGWYGLMPVLGYAVLKSFQVGVSPRRRQLIFLGVACVLWILVSAAVGGGDQWDNPRYRTLLLPWMVLLAVWGWERARLGHDPWLARFGVAQVIFVVIFLRWYISRYYPDVFQNWGIRFTVGITTVLILGFFAACLGWDLLRRKRRHE